MPARYRQWPLQSDDKTPTPGCVTKISDSAKLPVLEASLTFCIASSACFPSSTESAKNAETARPIERSSLRVSS